MRNTLIAAIILGLLGGGALAQSTRGGRSTGADVGPMAWPNAAAQWAALSQPTSPDANGTLPSRTKHLIGLAMAAGISCQECVVAHIAAAKSNGVTDAEIREVLAMTSVTPRGNTEFDGVK